MPFVEFDNRRIHYIDIDKRVDKEKGRDLLFVHGAGSSHIVWALQLMEFSTTNRCIAIDLSNHGKSEEVKGEASLENGYACEVGALVNHLDLQDFILIGHSMGGGVSMAYVLNDEFVTPKALVLIDTCPILNLPSVLPGLIKETVEENISSLKNQAFEEYLDRHRLQKYQAALKSTDPLTMQRDLRACNSFNITERVKDITIPTFGLVGEHDDIITPVRMKTFLQHLPRADIAVVRGANHVPMIEQPDEFNRLFRRFITWVEQNV
jgi:pimeloyl-ACP methyl ester carboxylesterase